MVKNTIKFMKGESDGETPTPIVRIGKSRHRMERISCIRSADVRVWLEEDSRDELLRREWNEQFGDETMTVALIKRASSVTKPFFDFVSIRRTLSTVCA